MDCQKVVSILCSHCKKRCNEYYTQIKIKKGGISYIENVHVSKRNVKQSYDIIDKISLDINAH